MKKQRKLGNTILKCAGMLAVSAGLVWWSETASLTEGKQENGNSLAGIDNRQVENTQDVTEQSTGLIFPAPDTSSETQSGNRVVVPSSEGDGTSGSNISGAATDGSSENSLNGSNVNGAGTSGTSEGSVDNSSAEMNGTAAEDGSGEDIQGGSQGETEDGTAIERTLLDLEDYETAPSDNGRPYYIKVNRLQNVVTVYALDENGRYTVPVRAMVCSTGRSNGTPTGTFRTSDKHDWSYLEGGVYGQYAFRIDGHILFHSVPYFIRNKARLETEEYNRLGTSVSLGCVRLAVSDVKWIYDNCPVGTLVKIYDSDYPGPFGKPGVEYIDTADERAGWDPLDPDIENPWNTGDIRILGAKNRILERGYSYNLMAGITVLDGQGNDVTEYLSAESELDPFTTGTYPVRYTVTLPEQEAVSLNTELQVVDTKLPEVVIPAGMFILNRIQAESPNALEALQQQVQVYDLSEKLSSDHVRITLPEFEERASLYEVEVSAADDSGNLSAVQTVYLFVDWNPPEIGNPASKVVSGSDEEEIRQAILDSIPVTDSESGIDTIKVTWTKHISTDNYSVMVIAKDVYGNITTRFFDNFVINVE